MKVMLLGSGTFYLLLYCFVESLQATDAAARIVLSSALSGPCTETFEQKLRFDKRFIALEPKEPTIPGTFNIHANVSILRTVQYVGAEIELRLADWNADPLPCKERKPDGCGSINSCSYCDFCKQFHKLNVDVVKDGQRPDLSFNNFFGATTSCPIQPGDYSISANIDTPDSDFLNRYLPDELIDDLSPARQIPLYTTLWIYDTRFQDLNPHLSPATRAKLFNARKRDWVIGCYRIVSTLEYGVRDFNNRPQTLQVSNDDIFSDSSAWLTSI